MGGRRTVIDATGGAATVFLGHDRPAAVVAARVATNHQERVVWPEQAAAVRSIERCDFLTRTLAAPGRTLDGVVRSFLAAPLYQTDVAAAFATIYTAVYRPSAGIVDFCWPERRWTQTLDRFTAGRHARIFRGP